MMLTKLRRRVVRRTAFLLLAAIMGFTVEPVMGVVRDGEVHHETAVEAATHSGLLHADHAHEQGDSPATGDTQGDHEHGYVEERQLDRVRRGFRCPLSNSEILKHSCSVDC